jgi:hypothetical protein
MASETFKKRQKETARREKRLKKAARLMERRNQKTSVGTDLQEDKREPTAPKESTKIDNPKYFGSPIRPRDPRKKSEITLYTTRKR